MKTTIYRTGPMSIGQHDEDILQHWAEFDDRCPEGHVRRGTALFAAPDLSSGHYWLGTRASLGRPLIFNEITVESDNVRVYSVDDYNMVGEHYGSPSNSQIADIESYWNTSMTLTEWMQKVGEDPQGQWEVLLPVTEIIFSRVLPRTEIEELYVANSMEELVDDLNYFLEEG
jgi:hypothetical protein